MCDQAVLPQVSLLGGVYRSDDEVRLEGRWDEDIPASGYDSSERLVDLAQDGVDAEVVYPTLGMDFFPIEDPEFQWALFRAYNDWLAEEFCAPHKDRFFGIAMINHEDVDAAIKELKRVKQLGLVGVMVPLYVDDENPYYDERFDPLWAAAVENQMPINLHLTTDKTKKRSRNPATLSPGQRLRADNGGVQAVLLDMIAYGLFDRFPSSWLCQQRTTPDGLLT